MDPNQPSPVIAPGYTFSSVTDKISSIVLARRTPRGWYAGFGLAFLFVMLLLVSLSYLLVKGIGIWGNNQPVGWAFEITNFVWWIGIGHAGTLISAILLLLRQEWRTSINRFAEAMTLFAVACAGIYPLFHVGRPWLAYWLLPYPNTMGVWPQFRSPLLWDVFAVSTYATVSLMRSRFVGLDSDPATLRGSISRAGTHRVVHARDGLARLGAALGTSMTPPICRWPGSRRRSWSRSTRSSASTSRFRSCPAGTRRSSRRISSPAPSTPASMVAHAGDPDPRGRLEDFITSRHLQNMAKVMLLTGLIVGYGYLIEGFIAWYSGDLYEQFVPINRMTGPYAPEYWLLLFCNIVVPQLLWFRRVRTNVAALFAISLVVNVGMWLERFIIIVTSLSCDFLPLVVGQYADVLGLVHVCGHDLAVPWPCVSVPPLPPDDLDLRDAFDAA